MNEKNLDTKDLKFKKILVEILTKLIIPILLPLLIGVAFKDSKTYIAFVISYSILRAITILSTYTFLDFFKTKKVKLKILNLENIISPCLIIPILLNILTTLN